MSKVQAQRCDQVAHWIGRRRRQTELSAVNDCIKTRELHVIQRVSGIHPQIEVVPVAQPESSSHRSIQSKLSGSGDGVSSRIAVLSRSEESVCRRIQFIARG